MRKFVFGPVASRRLGVSLGVDLVPYKTCPLDCIYCEAKATTLLTMERREYVPVAQVLAELEETLVSRPKLDSITFSGSGEPTLNSGIGEVVGFLKSRYPEYPLTLLTNGLLLGDAGLRREIAPVDLVVPSLDGSCAAEFNAINRPAAGVQFDRFVRDLTEFTHAFAGKIHLELFIVPGINDSGDSIARFVELIRAMRVDLVQLNTLDRPGTEPDVRPATPEITRSFLRAIAPVCPVEAVGRFRCRSGQRFHLECGDPEKQVLAIAARRPVTAEDLQTALGWPPAEVEKLLDALFRGGLVEIEHQERGTFYRTVGRC